MNESAPTYPAAGVYVHAVGVQVTVPWAPSVFVVTVRASPSTSVSLATTPTVTGVSTAVDAVSSTAVGASFTAVTVTDTVTGAD